MDPKQIADGFMDVCRRLGSHAEQAETTLSTGRGREVGKWGT